MIKSSQRLIYFNFRHISAIRHQLPRYLSDESKDVANEEFMKRIQNLPEEEKFGEFSKRFSVTVGGIDIQEKMSNLESEDISDEQAIDEITNHSRLSSMRGHDLSYFVKKSQKLLKSKMYQEHKDMFYVDMLQTHRIKPNTFVLNNTIHAHSELGEAREARELLQKMLSYRMVITPFTIGNVFTAYAYCNDREFASVATEKLYHYIKRIDFPVDYQVASRMLLACSKDGNVRLMMLILDDMLLNWKIRPDARSLTYLLQACKLDTKMGASLAIQIFRRFLDFKNFQFKQSHFVLLLGCVCKCGIGDADRFVETLFPGDDVELIPNTTDEKLTTTSETALTTFNFDHDHVHLSPINVFSKDIVNLTKSDLHNFVISLEEGKNRRNISLIGGMKGVFQLMDEMDVRINEYILTTCISFYGKSNLFRDLFKEIADKYGMKKDTYFYNALIKASHDREAKNQLLKEMKGKNVPTDIVTDSILVSKIKPRASTVRKFMKSIEKAGRLPTLTLCKHLYNKSRYNYATKYVILDSMEQFEVYPDKEFIEQVELDIHDFRENLLKYEAGEEASSLECNVDDQHVKRFFIRFVKHYKEWLRIVALQS